MINREDVLKLATLARIKMSDLEADSFVGEIDPILEYVGQVKNIDIEDTQELDQTLINIMREDGAPHESGKYSEDILSQSPQREGDHISVKKIL